MLYNLPFASERINRTLMEIPANKHTQNRLLKHEILSPLNYISGLAELLGEKIDSETISSVLGLVESETYNIKSALESFLMPQLKTPAPDWPDLLGKIREKSSAISIILQSLIESWPADQKAENLNELRTMRECAERIKRQIERYQGFKEKDYLLFSGIDTQHEKKGAAEVLRLFAELQRQNPAEFYAEFEPFYQRHTERAKEPGGFEFDKFFIYLIEEMLKKGLLKNDKKVMKMIAPSVRFSGAANLQLIFESEKLTPANIIEHEINNPLTYIMMEISSLLFDDEENDSLKAIDSNIQRMVNIISKLGKTDKITWVDWENTLLELQQTTEEIKTRLDSNTFNDIETQPKILKINNLIRFQIERYLAFSEEDFLIQFGMYGENKNLGDRQAGVQLALNFFGEMEPMPFEQRFQKFFQRQMGRAKQPTGFEYGLNFIALIEKMKNDERFQKDRLFSDLTKNLDKDVLEICKNSGLKPADFLNWLSQLNNPSL